MSRAAGLRAAAPRGRRLAAPALLLAAACATVVTPAAVAEADWPEAERAELLDRWQGAVDLANAFLADEANLSLPPARLDLDHEAGMTLQLEEGARPVRVENTWWGDVCVSMGFAAQERSWGFVVGDRGEGPQAVAHSLFYTPWETMKSEEMMAELILHEVSHMVHEEGTVGFCAGVSYYWHAMCHGGGREHPAERLPYATSDEFLAWAEARADAP